MGPQGQKHKALLFHERPNLISFASFHLFSFVSFFVVVVELLCLFVNDERVSVFLILRYGHEKHKSFKNFVSIAHPC
jgi:hypothetical protein